MLLTSMEGAVLKGARIEARWEGKSHGELHWGLGRRLHRPTAIGGRDGCRLLAQRTRTPRLRLEGQR